MAPEYDAALFDFAQVGRSVRRLAIATAWVTPF
jgi:hypothetical protein